MGVLYARVGGAWVPIGNGLAPTPPFDPSPAYVGKRQDYTPDAWFSRVGINSGELGMGIRDPNLIYMNFPSAGQIQMNPIPGSTVFQALNGRVNMATWSFGLHPAAGQYSGLWRNGADSINDYVILARPQETLLNVPAGGYHGFRIGNAEGMNVQGGSVNINGRPLNVGGMITGTSVLGQGGVTSNTDVHAVRRFYQNGPDVGFSMGWNEAHFVCAGAGYYGARLGLNYGGATGQLRLGQWKGNALETVAGDASTYILHWASGFPTESTIKVKRDVRSIYPERERITVRRDPWSDTVDPPDVMSLRPVAFRPKRGAIRWNDETQEHEPDDHPVWSIEGRRERLGLIAEEVETVLPSAVYHDMDGSAAGIDYAQVTVALLAHVQQLTETIATLKYRITELENR